LVAAENCSDSVDPCSAVVEDWPSLMTGCGIAERFAFEFTGLEVGVGAHAAGFEIARQLEKAVVECVKTGERNELELIPHGVELFAERCDLCIVEFFLPVEGWRAVVCQ
jgi:hypothetical protein